MRELRDGGVVIFTADHIVSMSATDAAAFACLGGWVIATGGVDELRRRFPQARVTDFGRAVIVPGLNDAHQHPTLTAEDLLHTDLSQTRSRSDIVASLRSAANRIPAGQWARGSRYDHTKSSSGTVLTRADLDVVSEHHPVLVVHVAAHWGVVNSAGLVAAGLDDDGEDPPGGTLGRDAAGRLNGVLYEQALFDVAYPALARRPPVVPPSGLEDRLRGLKEAQRRLHAAGITSVGDAMVGPDGLELLQEADARGLLTLRVNLLVTHTHFDHLRRLGLRSDFGGSRLRIGGIKAFVDGAVAGGTCLVEQPYEGTHDHGMQTLSDAELLDLVRRVHSSGSRLAVHANGDRAIGLLLDAVERAQAEYPRSDAHHRIEHCTVVNDEIVARMRRLGLTAVPFGSYIAFHGDKLVGYYGTKRLERMFAHRTFLDAGIPVAGSSDYPCGPYEPLLALQSCVTRQAADGTVLGGSQRISPYEALALYTTGSAHASGESGIKGRIAPGYLADFVVLEDDPLRVPPERLSRIPIRETWVGGRRVWSQDADT